MVWAVGGAHRVVDVANGDLVATIAQHIIANENVLIDAAVTLGCVCSGASAAGGRDAVVAIEPPRASSPVIDEAAPIQLELRVPAASRTPVDVMAISPLSTPSVPHPALPLSRPPGEGPGTSVPLAGGSWDPPRRQTPPAGVNASDVSNAPRQPESRDRRILPRAYIVRRRPSPRSTPAVPPNNPQRPTPRDAKTTESARVSADDQESHESRNGHAARENEAGEQEEETLLESQVGVDAIVPAELEPTETPPAAPASEPEATVDLLPPPPIPSPVASEARPILEIAPPLRVVENTPAKEQAAVLPSPGGSPEQPRLLSATRTAVRDLRDAFMVTVSRPGETVTGSQPPEGVTGSIGGVTPLMNEQVTMVRVRNVILVILAFVALIVVVALPVLIIVDRRLNPPPTASAPVNP